jgi:hypothetical protein
MDFLAQKLLQNSFSDVANNNNNLNGKISDSQRRRIADLIQHDVQKVESHPTFLKEIFLKT